MAIPIYTQLTLGQVQARARAGPFSLVVAEHTPGALLPPHGHESMHICFILRGGFVEGCRGRQIDCQSGTLIVKGSGYEHWNRISMHGARSLAICAETEEVWRDFAPAWTEFQISQSPLAGALAYRLHWEMLFGDKPCPLDLEGSVLELISTLAQPFRDAARHGAPHWLSRARELLHDNSGEFDGLSHLAARVGVHPVHLARAFRQRFGCTVGDYLRAERVAQAKHLLAQSAEPIAEIAARVGFSDQPHLTRVFRRAVGITPAAFRRRHGLARP